MPIFRQMQACLFTIPLVTCLLPPCTAQHKTPSASSRPNRKETNRAVETLFALVGAKARSLQQENVRVYTKAGDDYPYVYHVIEVAPYARRYRIDDWQPMRADRATEGGIAGDWAEVAESGQDRRGKRSDQGSWSLYHRIRGHWKRIAFHEGLGYEPNAVRRAGIPRSVIQRLKLAINE